ncbi:MAG: cyclic nucleotide-binding domain-containing protein [Gemmatimonadetes bacterium]|nr:cyclic nucleotide-binding domain-containing protein [Gemmatimonadota bacterium]MBT4609001.1 cyclic nucleotide-binding domain-containing protein [Gemmatimonadota bacterium]MBT5060505.1 cyclic nucleotide-binding domain-containing protein [Gemmatimonadota bacterium]MBT5142525.1 cyclic nucleotide-binding domain-containing protein [Gemmatimonadota bacterium]MBT5587158.1 cyclic nucleotide-binding domain-containing protein [Gemmatimonadota bacterium]
MTERGSVGRSQEQALIGRLQQAPLLHRLAGRYLQVLRKIARPRTFSSQQVVIEAGAIGPGLFILLKGQWEVGEAQESAILLEPIVTAGELSELMDTPQTAQVRSTGDSVALHIQHEVLATLFTRDAEFHQRLCRNAIADLSAQLVSANKKLDRLSDERGKVEVEMSAAEMELSNVRMLKSMRG